MDVTDAAQAKIAEEAGVRSYTLVGLQLILILHL